MVHVAIMKKEWNLIPYIINGEKTIETRWYKSKRSPWNRIKQGETIYFKDSGKPISARAIVSKVEQFEIIDDIQKQLIIESVWEKDVIRKELFSLLETYAKNKKYCIIIHLRNAERLEPFMINKKGFGMQTAWICVDDIKSIAIS